MQMASANATPEQNFKKKLYTLDSSSTSNNNLSKSIAPVQGSLASEKKVFIKSGEKQK